MKAKEVPTMTAKEFRRIRDKAELTLKETANYLGSALRSVQHWEGGARPVPGPVEVLMLLLDEYPEVYQSVIMLTKRQGKGGAR
jgi:DNA-binding transcriptional regulator YiaG